MEPEKKRFCNGHDDTKMNIHSNDNSIIQNNGPKKIYLDYNGTTPLAPSVINKISTALTDFWGNPSSKSSNGIRSKQAITQAREHTCEMINGDDASEVIFMSGGTEANNHIICNSIKYFKEFLGYDSTRKPHFISSTIEHDSIAKVLDAFEKLGAIDVTYVPVSKTLGFVDPVDVLRAIREETVLITIMLANNETGVLQPLKDICVKVKQNNKLSRSNRFPTVYVHTDAAQCIGKVNVDVQDIGVDYLTIVGHKFYAPRIGALWVRSNCPYYPMLYGGGQESGKRSGTENTCMIVGLGEAARLVTENISQYNKHFCTINKFLRDRLKSRFGEKVQFNSPYDSSLPNTLNISFVGSNNKGSKVLSFCKRIEASVGAACHSQCGNIVSRILLCHHIPDELAGNALRLSTGRETTVNDINTIVEDLEAAIKLIPE